MAKIRPAPNAPYLLADGTPNAGGQVRLFVAGTTTPLTAWTTSDETVSYGSVIDLNAAGLPTSGAIYWRVDSYKVEVYRRVDDTPTYSLEYTVDNFV